MVCMVQDLRCGTGPWFGFGVVSYEPPGGLDILGGRSGVVALSLPNNVQVSACSPL